MSQAVTSCHKLTVSAALASSEHSATIKPSVDVTSRRHLICSVIQARESFPLRVFPVKTLTLECSILPSLLLNAKGHHTGSGNPLCHKRAVKDKFKLSYGIYYPALPRCSAIEGVSHLQV